MPTESEITTIKLKTIEGLPGLASADQHVLNAEVLVVAAALAHKTRHAIGGADEIDITGLSGAGVGALTAGDILFVKSDGAANGNEEAFTKRKEIWIANDGTLRVKFDLRVTAGKTAHGRVYKNGVAVGTDQTTTSASYVTFSEDIAGFANGDLVQLYAYIIDPAGNLYTVGNFRLYSGSRQTGVEIRQES